MFKRIGHCFKNYTLTSVGEVKTMPSRGLAIIWNSKYVSFELILFFPSALIWRQITTLLYNKTSFTWKRKVKPRQHCFSLFPSCLWSPQDLGLRAAWRSSPRCVSAGATDWMAVCSPPSPWWSSVVQKGCWGTGEEPNKKHHKGRNFHTSQSITSSQPMTEKHLSKMLWRRMKSLKLGDLHLLLE